MNSGASHTTEELDAVVTALGGLPEATWPGGYHQTGLAVLDAIYSVNARYEPTVRNVIARYRAHRPSADADSASDLISAIDGAGGPARFAAEVVKNRQRTSSTNGILKSDAARQCAHVLVDLGMDRAEQVRAAVGTADIERLKRGWLAVKGQHSGITFRYFLMLLKVPGVKADRMIHRFIREVIGHDLDDEGAAELISAAADELGMDATAADHRIWSATSKR